MLWYKAWLETRARFAVALAGVSVLCSYNVFHGNREGLSYAKADYYYAVLHGSYGLLAVMWILAVTLLMMGGLLREKVVGSSLLTLALPVSRGRLMAARLSFGVVQAVVLAVVPCGAMYVIEIFTGRADSGFQALFHLVLLLGGGLVFFAQALLVSSLIEGEYTAPAVAYGVALTIAVAFNSRNLRGFSPFAFILGVDYFDRSTSLLVGSLPWLHVAAYMLVAAILVTISLKLIEKREF